MTISKSLRVLEIGKYYPPHRGGMESHLKALCDALSGRVELTVVVANDEARTASEMVDGVRVIRTATFGQVASTPVCPFLPYLLGQISADVVHIHVPNPAAIVAYLASGISTPLVITYHSDTVRQQFLGAMFAPILDQALRRARIICTSPQYRETSRALRPHRERCEVIPLSVSTDHLLPTGSGVREIRARYGPNILLAVGRLVYYKGLEYLIEAMTRVPAHLLIIGQGPLRQTLELAAKRHGVSDRVSFLGNVDEAGPYYHAADVFVLPSIARTEAFGIVQLEAMICGKPVVNTKLDSGVPFVSLDGVTGLTVPPSDSGALASAINLLIERPELRERFGAAARHRARTQFSVAAMAEATLQLLERTAQIAQVKRSAAAS